MVVVRPLRIEVLLCEAETTRLYFGHSAVSDILVKREKFQLHRVSV